jgi:hypothetical protein
VCKVKPGLVEPEFPAVELHTHRSIPEAMIPENRDVLGEREALSGKRPPMKWLKEANRAPNHTERLTPIKAGSPKSREAQGDGVAIVAKCLGECPGQDEGRQRVL